MVFQPAPGIAQIEMVFGLGANLSENVFHVMGAASYTADDLQTLANIFISWENSLGKHNRSHQMGLEKVIGTDLSTETSPRFVQTSGLPINGSVIANVYPENVTWAVKAETGLRGRSQRGRTYWIGLSEDVVVVDELDPTIAASIVANLNSLVAQVAAAAPWKMCVLSRFHNNAPRAAGIGNEILRFAANDLTTDSQRRRLPGHNRHR